MWIVELHAQSQDQISDHIYNQSGLRIIQFTVYVYCSSYGNILIRTVCRKYGSCTLKDYISMFDISIIFVIRWEYLLARCKPGFTLNSEGKCVDVDECQTAGACNENAVCSNTVGNFTCTCESGFQDDGAGNCVRVCPSSWQQFEVYSCQ
jgi:hypothetical protein